MKVYVLITDGDSSDVISGLYSSREQLITALTTVFSAEVLKRVEIWDVDKGFLENLNISKKTVVTIED